MGTAVNDRGPHFRFSTGGKHGPSGTRASCREDRRNSEAGRPARPIRGPGPEPGALPGVHRPGPVGPHDGIRAGVLRTRDGGRPVLHFGRRMAPAGESGPGEAGRAHHGPEWQRRDVAPLGRGAECPAGAVPPAPDASHLVVGSEGQPRGDLSEVWIPTAGRQARRGEAERAPDVRAQGRAQPTLRPRHLDPRRRPAEDGAVGRRVGQASRAALEAGCHPGRRRPQGTARPAAADRGSRWPAGRDPGVHRPQAPDDRGRRPPVPG